MKCVDAGCDHVIMKMSATYYVPIKMAATHYVIIKMAPLIR